MSKKEYTHVDAIGRPLNIGDIVACASSPTSLLIGSITALGEKQIRIVHYGQTDKSSDWKGRMVANGKYRYPKEVVLLDGPDVTMYLLKLKN